MYNSGYYPNYGGYTQGFYPMPNQNQGINQNPQQSTPQNQGITWVQGESGAKAYIVAPNSTVVLWDSENPVIYIKSADMSGLPTMRILDWTERTAPQQPPIQKPAEKTEEYVTRQEFDEVVKRLNSLSRNLPQNTKSNNNNSNAVKEDNTHGKPTV